MPRDLQRTIQTFADHFDSLERVLGGTIDLRLDRIILATSLRLFLIDRHLSAASACFDLPLTFYVELSGNPVELAALTAEDIGKFRLLTSGKNLQRLSIDQFLELPIISGPTNVFSVKNIIEAASYNDGALHPNPSHKLNWLQPLVANPIARAFCLSVLLDISRVVVSSMSDLRFLIEGGKASGDLVQPKKELMPLVRTEKKGMVCHFEGGRHLYNAASVKLEPGFVLFLAPCLPPLGVPSPSGTMLEMTSGFDDMPRLRLVHKSLGRVSWQLTKQHHETPLNEVEARLPVGRTTTLALTVDTTDQGTRLGMKRGKAEFAYSYRIKLPSDLRSLLLGRISVGADSRARKGAVWQNSLVSLSRPMPSKDFASFVQVNEHHMDRYLHSVGAAAWV